MSEEQTKLRSAGSGFRIIAVVCVFILVFSAAVIIRQAINHSTTGYGANFRVQAQLNMIQTAIHMFEADNGRFPERTNGLTELVNRPAGLMSWHQYLAERPLDPWGHPYLYVYPGKHNTNSFDLSSAGPDGIPGTSDDIVNW